MSAQPIAPETVAFPPAQLFTPEQSHTLAEMRWADGVLVLRFRDHKRGGIPGPFEYDYPDPDGAHASAIWNAERPGTEARQRIRSGSLLHSAKRPVDMPVEVKAAPETRATIQGGTIALVEMPTTPAIPDTGKQLETKALTLSDQAAALVITDQPSYDYGVDLLRTVKAFRDKAEAELRPAIDAAHKAHKAILGVLQRVDVPLEKAERNIKSIMAAWTIEQERIRRAEEDRLRLEQEKAREAEIEAQIEQAEAEGADQTEVLAMIEQAAMAPAPPPPTVVPVYKPAAGVAVRKTFAAEVTSLRQLIQHVAQHPDLEYLLAADLPKLNQLARMQGAGLRIPGVRVIEKSSVAVR